MSQTATPNPDNANDLPVLYSLRNCPYAMRARIAIFKARQTIELRDIVLSNKPEEMISVSPKATVPVLVLKSGEVIEESLQVMLWALNETDPNDLLHRSNKHALTEMLALINDFDESFKDRLEQYKCAKRYKENNVVECRVACEQFIQSIETRLTQHAYLMSEKESLADIAILPFIRQFARVERQWYVQSQYTNVKRWLNRYLQSSMFTKVMAKYPLWLECRETTLFGAQ